MATNAELQKRIAELEAAQARAETLYQISSELNTAHNADELLQALARPAIEAGAFGADYTRIGVDKDGELAWSEVIASWQREGTPVVSVGTRFHLSEFPFVRLWMDDPDEPLLVADVTTARGMDETTRNAYVQLGARALAIIPLIQTGRWVGLLIFLWDEPHKFSEQEVEIYRALTGLAPPAVESCRLAEAARTQAEELAVLNEMGRTLTMMLDVDAVVESLYHHASRLIDTSHFYVALYDPKQDMVSFPLYIEEGQTIRLEPFRSGRGLTGYVIRTREPLLIEENVAARVEELDIEAFRLESLSWLGVPMTIGGRVIGVISAHSHTTPRLYNEHHRDLLVAIASQAAIAIENARLFEQTQARAEELAVLNEMGRTLTAMLDVDAVIESLYHHASRLIDTSHFYVALYHPEQDMVSFPLVIEEGQKQHLEQRRSGKGLTEYVIRTREPLLMEENVPARVEELGIEPIGLESVSWLGVPMTMGGRVIGVISAHTHTTPRLYNEHHRDLLVAIANQAVVAIENARLYEKVQQELTERKQAEEALQKAYEEVEKQVEERTAELKRETAERERLQQEVIEAQKQTLQELSTPIIPVMDRIIVMPLIGSIDTIRAKDIMRALLAGIHNHRAKVVILDITGVPIVDSGVANHLNKTIQAARLKGAQTIVTGVSDAVAEAIVDLGIDWGGVETLADLQTGLKVALASMGLHIG